MKQLNTTKKWYKGKNDNHNHKVYQVKLRKWHGYWCLGHFNRHDIDYILVSEELCIRFAFCCIVPANTFRNNNVVITSRRRHFDVITSKWRRFDVITTLLLRHVFSGVLQIGTGFDACHFFVRSILLPGIGPIARLPYTRNRYPG